MAYTSVEMIQMIVAATVGVTSIISAVVAGVAAVRAGRVEKQQAVMTVKQALLADKVDIVETQTNSHLVRMEKKLEDRDLALAKQYLAQITSQEEARKELAHQAALAVALAAVPVAHTRPAPSAAAPSSDAVVVQSAESVTIMPLADATPTPER